jgi:Ca-activated chloride channel family protein
MSSSTGNHAATASDRAAEAGSSASANQASSFAPLPPPVRYDRGDYDAMYFESFETNPFIATEDDALSTFAAEVDTGSYSIVRNYIQRGTLPPKEAFRVEEFINSFALNAPPPGPGEGVFRVLVEGGPSPFGEGYEMIRITLKGKEVEPEERKPANLTFVIDSSGSMERENRLGLVQQSLRLLVNALNEDDRIGIVTYGSEAHAVLRPTPLSRKEAILEAIDGIRPGGSTNAEEGLKLGYEMASRQYDEAAINRVILLSDGVANVGKTEAEDILKEVEDYTAQGITLTTVGVGMGNYNDVLMEQLADRGNGVYAYVDRFSEARRLFLEQLTGTLQTIARDVKIQVAFDAEKVDRYRLLGYENRDMRDEDFEREDADAGEIGAGHVVTALYEVKRRDGAEGSLGEVRVRYVDEETREAGEVAAPLIIGGELSRETSFLAAAAEYAEIMRGSFWARDSSLDAVLALAESSAQGEDQQAFVAMVKDTIAIRRSMETEKPAGQAAGSRNYRLRFPVSF